MTMGTASKDLCTRRSLGAGGRFPPSLKLRRTRYELRLGVVCTIMIVCLSTGTYGQNRWEKYDSIYYENLFVPNFSNLLMPKGYVEVLVNSSLLSTNQLWNGSSKRIDYDRRYSYNFVTAIGNIGVSESNRFNAGVEVHYAVTYTDQDRQSSSLRLFAPNRNTNIDQAQAFTSFGPRIKLRPFRNLNLVVVSTVQIPLVKDVYKKALLGGDETYWGNQFLYSFALGKHLTFFAEDDVYVYFSKDGTGGNHYLNSINLYSYLIVSKHFFPFVSAGYNTAYASSPLKEQNRYVPIGAGLQYQHSLRFTLNVFVSQYVTGKNYSDWRTVSVGVRRVF